MWMNFRKCNHLGWQRSQIGDRDFKTEEQLSSTPTSSSPAFKQMSATLKRQQWSLNNNDVAHRCMSIVGFADEPPDARRTRLEGLMSESLPHLEWVNIDSIMTGPRAHKHQPTSASLSSILKVAVMLLWSSSAIRTSISAADRWTICVLTGWTEMQLTRNYALTKQSKGIY